MSIRSSLVDRLLLPEPFQSSWRGYSSEGDFICPQAFGRNTYSDRKVGMIVGSIIESLHNSQIDTFRALFSRGFDPGTPNKALALRCLELAKASPMTGPRPVIGQWEVLYAMWEIDQKWYEDHEKMLCSIWPPIQGYLGTRGMLLIVRDIADTHSLKMPVLVAHAEHIQRCFFIARKVFGYPVATDHSLIRDDTRCFDQRSVQKWTRNEGAWLRYEMMARVHHRLHGWI